MRSDIMRTFSEINRDIQDCKHKLNTYTKAEEKVYYNSLLLKLYNEKDEVWNTYFEGHRNRRL